MPAYFVYICQEVVDRSELEIYWSRIGSTLEGYGARSVAAYTPFEQLEGDAVDGAAVVEFPSMELAKTWYNSPAYRAIMHHRQQAATLHRPWHRQQVVSLKTKGQHWSDPFYGFGGCLAISGA